MQFAIKTLEFDKVKSMVADKAATRLGREAIAGLRIATDYATVEHLLKQTGDALNLLNLGKRLPFGGCFDITQSLKKAEIGSVLEPEELLHVASTLAAINAMVAFLQLEKDNIPTLYEYRDRLDLFFKLEKQIFAIVDEHGEIKDSASPKLSGLRVSIITARNKVKQQLDEILHNNNNQKYFQDAIVTMRGDRYVIPIKQEYKMNFPGVVHDQSSTGATLFIEPLAVVNYNNDIKRYLAEEWEEIERILHQITLNIGEETSKIRNSLAIMTELDVVWARGNFALSTHAVEPQLMKEYYLNIHGGRHPLLDPQKVVPLSVELGKDIQMLLITGPNTGGKTVALKTVGLFALMMQSGMFLPALNVKMPIFQGVYADIGDEQSIEQSLSTFSAHMKTMIEILNVAKTGDLVLIDELCAGTDPNEGAALAMSILENLHNRNILTMVTTHYSELKTFAYSHQGMMNASVEFDAQTLMPTYKLLMGVPGSSNAFNISKRLGLQEELVENAKLMLNQEHIHMESVLQDLNEKRRDYEESTSVIEKARFEAEMLRNQLAYQKREFMKHRNDMLRKAKEEADEIYRASRRETEEVLKELRSFKNDFDAKKLQEFAAKAKEKLSVQFAVDTILPEGTPLTLATAKEGQSVFVTTFGKNGVITSVNSKDVSIRMGALRLNIKPEECILTKAQPVSAVPEREKKGRKRSGHHELMYKKNASIKLDVDLRRMLVEEALPVIDKAIDDAILSGADRLRIIHGKGTGALKAGVVPYLKQHSMVLEVLPAINEEGGAGATVIKIGN
ncbi:MAG: endonuclease MutS2 [Acidaminococcaceae bacterium]|nr:endonuclease MutS2 [Acidaminococcaceae bacterium]